MVSNMELIVERIVNAVTAKSCQRDAQGPSAAEDASSLVPNRTPALERAALIGDLAGIIREALSPYSQWAPPLSQNLEDPIYDILSVPRPSEEEECDLVIDPRLWVKDVKWHGIRLTPLIINRIIDGMRSDVVMKATDVPQRKELEVQCDAFRHLCVHISNSKTCITAIGPDTPLSRAVTVIYDRFRLLHSVDGLSGTARGAALAVGASSLLSDPQSSADRFRDMATAVRETAVLINAGAPRTQAQSLSRLPGNAALAVTRAGGPNDSSSPPTVTCNNCARPGHVARDCRSQGGGAHRTQNPINGRFGRGRRH